MKAVTDDNQAVDFVRLRAQGVDAGTRGTIYFDDPSTRFRHGCASQPASSGLRSAWLYCIITEGVESHDG